MQKQGHGLANIIFTTCSQLRERLVYLPGGLVLLYGFWLSLTA